MGAFYSTICIWLPGARPYHQGSLYWTGEEKRFGVLTCVGMALVFWLPAFTYLCVVTGFISERYMLAVYLAILPGVLVGIVGSLVDWFS